MLAYLLVSSMGGSSRAELLVLPLVCSMVWWVVFAGLHAIEALDVSRVRMRHSQAALFEDLQRLVTTDGVSRAKMVFASSFDVYFPDLAGFTPYTNGGWWRFGQSPYNDAYPEICVASLECFQLAAKIQGITHVILMPDSRLLSDALHALYVSAPKQTSADVQPADSRLVPGLRRCGTPALSTPQRLWQRRLPRN